jgi:hypothetical protein
MAFAAITSALSSTTPAVAASVDVLVSRAAGHEVYADWQLTNGPEWCVDAGLLKRHGYAVEEGSVTRLRCRSLACVACAS